ncbi:MAG: hypothetical protein QM777_01520 [Pseudorhodoferax sp.]
MDDLARLPCVKQGLWFHGGVTACHVRIVRHDLLYGTGDADDPPEIARDQPTDCYYVLFDLPHAESVWHNGGAALSLREAVFLVERRLGPVLSWND